MRNMLFAIALSLTGAVALSGTASAAPISGIASSGETVIASEMLQPVGGYRWRHHHHHKGKKFIRFGKKFVFLPEGYYKGFCYDNRGHWWCRKYFFKHHRKGY